MQESRQENCEMKVLTEVIQGKLGIQLPEYAIERAHRVGRNGIKKRPVIIKFVNYKNKWIYVAQHSLYRALYITVADVGSPFV